MNAHCVNHLENQSKNEEFPLEAEDTTLWIRLFFMYPWSALSLSCQVCKIERRYLLSDLWDVSEFDGGQFVAEVWEIFQLIFGVVMCVFFHLLSQYGVPLLFSAKKGARASCVVWDENNYPGCSPTVMKQSYYGTIVIILLISAWISCLFS